MSRKPAFRICIAGLLVILFAACTSTNPASPPSTKATQPSSPTATSLPSGTVLFQANLSAGLAQWPGTIGWKVTQGQLEVSSNQDASLLIPYKPTVSNYASEVRLQVVRLVHQDGGYYNIIAMKQPGKDGYKAGIGDLKGPEPRQVGSHPETQVFIDPQESTDPSSPLPTDYEPGYIWRTYRVEVQGSQVRMLIDGVSAGRAISDATKTLSNGPLSLMSSEVILRVSSIRILVL